jgi:dTDP-4-amino-4,6-dideoxygalactose transaminase
MTGHKSFIPFNGLKRQYQNLKHEILHEQDIVMSSGKLLNGHKLMKFEEDMAKLCGREYAIAVNSGTNALHYIFDLIQRHRELLFQPQEMGIAIPNYSFKSTQNVIAGRGKQILVDVKDDSGLMDVSSLFANQTIDVLMYVNLYGNMINYEELITVVRLFINNPDCIIIEDACQSFGSSFKDMPSGSFGDFSVLSFDPTKNLPCYGGGGMILTDDPTYISWLWEYVRNGSIGHGKTVNSFMSELECAEMLVKLKYFDEWQERRTKIAEYYSENLHDSIMTPHDTVTEGVTHNFHKYVILSNRRDTIASRLEEAQIETKIHYKAEAPFAWPGEQLSNIGARTMAANVLSLPIYPELTDSEVERIVEKVNKPLNSNVKLMRSTNVKLLD